METVLRFVSLGFDSRRCRDSHRSQIKHPIASPVEEAATVTHAPLLIGKTSARSNFRKLEERAAMLGIKMAQQGFTCHDNPYTTVNDKLEAVWLSSFGKYQGTVRKLAL